MRVYSSFKFSQGNLAMVDKDLSFAEYVDMVLSGRLEALRKRVYQERNFFALSRDVDYSRYVRHIRRWAAVFPPENLVVTLFEEMKDDPQAFTRDLCLRLGLEPDFFDDYDFPLANRTVRVKGHFFHRLVRQWTGWVPRTPTLRKLYHSYLRLQAAPKEGMAPEDREALERLRQDLRQDNQELAEEFSLDLGAWAEGESVS